MTREPFPRTLARMAGLSDAPSQPGDSVLVVIDAQLEYTRGAVPLAGMDEAVAEAARLLAFARGAGMPVFHAIHHGRAGGALFDPQKSLVDFIPSLAPAAGETVIVKHLPNAFAGTDLAERIRATGRSEIVIAGFATHMCVSATARSALDHGYRVTVVANATATRALPHPLGRGVVPAEVIHEATLSALSDRFAVIVRDTQALAA